MYFLLAMINIVHNATLSLIPKEERLPPQAMGAFMLVHKVHAAWMYLRKWSIYSNPQNFPALLAGHAVNHYLGNYLVIRVSAQCVLLVTRVIACAEQYRAFYHACLNAKDSLYCTYPIVQTSNKVKQTAYRLQDIAQSAFNLLWEAFKLSMCYMDVITVLSFSADTTDEGIKEVFYNSFKSIDTLTENKQELLNSLNNNKALISTILKPLPGGYTAEVLIKGVTSILNGAEWVSGATKHSLDWRGITNGFHSVLFTTTDLPSPFYPYPSLEMRNPFPPRKLVTFELIN